MIWPLKRCTQVSLSCLNSPSTERNCSLICNHKKGCSSAGIFSLCHPACALLQLPTFLSLFLLPAGAAWLGCARGAVSRLFPLLEVSRSSSSSAHCTVCGYRGLPVKPAPNKCTGEFCPYLVKRFWTRDELMSSTGCLANSHRHSPGFI